MHQARKALATLVLCVISCTTLCAQNMKVLQFRELTNDLTANLYGTSKTDDNGEVAALIKIVTTEKGFTFDGGSLGIVATEYKAGEIWLYVPRRAQRLTISHSSYGVLRDYVYPIPIEGAKTYEMLLDPGIGRMMNISSTEPGSTIYLDNDSIGVSPIVNRYVLFGHHRLAANKGYMEGEMEIDVTQNTAENCVIRQRNVQNEYHRVRLVAEHDVQIMRDGQVIGSGTWEGILRNGNYVYRTHRENYDDAETFVQIDDNTPATINLNNPKPVYGFLKLHVTPVRATVKTTAGRLLSHREVISLPVGHHHLSFEASGYYDRKDEPFDIKPNQTLEDTIRLKPIDYVKSTSFYIGGGFTVASLSGASVTAGMTLFNVDVQLTYTIGMAATDDVSWYTEANNSFYSRMNYKMNMFAARLGYQIHLTNRLAITPQVGFVAQTLSGNTVEGSGSLGDNASASSFTVGAKFVIIPTHHVGIFLMPEFGLGGKETDAFKAIADKTNLSAGGLIATAGVFFNF